MNERHLLSFRDELQKLALNPRLGASATLGVLGALGGGGVGALKHHLRDEEGSTSGAALRGALAGGLGGAGVGAVLPEAARKTMSRFGMRELHGLTGFIPKGESVRSMHGGAFPQRMARVQAERAVGRAKRTGGDIEGAQQHLRNSDEAVKAMEGAESWGMTSIPGVFKAMKQHGVLPVIGRGAKAQFSGTTPLNKAVMLGMPALGLASAARAAPAEGAGRGEAIGYQGGQIVGGLAGSVLPFGVGQIFQEGAGRAGRAVGYAVDAVGGTIRPKVKQNPPNPFRAYGPHPADSSDLTKAPGENTPSETIMTARASGTPPESQA